jgi:hypothetical protein
MKRSLIITLISLLALGTVSAQNKAIPIAEMGVSGLLGGVEKGRWITSAKMAAKMKEQTEFVFVGWKGVEEGGVSTGTKDLSQDVCQDFIGLKFDLEMESGIALGSDAKWKPVPRIPQGIALTNEVYKKAIADYLRTKGIAKTVIKLTQAYRVDLEGDGTDEVLLTATYYKGGLDASPTRGDYSVILLRKAVGKTVVNYMIAGDFITKSSKFSAPSEYKLSVIADLNGDGKMEIVTYGAYYEGEFAGVMEMKGGKPVPVKELDIGCGV